jgi:hypothetical protein
MALRKIKWVITGVLALISSILSVALLSCEFVLRLFMSASTKRASAVSSAAATTRRRSNAPCPVEATTNDPSIWFDHRRQAFVHRGRLVPGLLPSLQKLLYPRYNWMEARKRSPRVNSARHQHVDMEATENGSTSLARQQCSGKQNGSKLDRQLHHSIQLARRYNLKPEVFTNSQKRRAAMKDRTPKEKKHLETIVANFILPTVNFWRMCAIKHYTPQYSQVTVGNPLVPVATKVDVKCWDEAKRGVVIIENKVGYANHYHAATGNMLAPHQDKPDSAYNQHQIQLAVTSELHRTYFPSQPIAASYVWKYDADGVSVHPLESWAKDRAARVVQLLAMQRAHRVE